LRGGGGRRTPRGCVSFTPLASAVGSHALPALESTAHATHHPCILLLAMQHRGCLWLAPQRGGDTACGSFIAMRRGKGSAGPTGPRLARLPLRHGLRLTNVLPSPLASQKRLLKMTRVTCGARNPASMLHMHHNTGRGLLVVIYTSGAFGWPDRQAQARIISSPPWCRGTTCLSASRGSGPVDPGTLGRYRCLARACRNVLPQRCPSQEPPPRGMISCYCIEWTHSHEHVAGASRGRRPRGLTCSGMHMVGG
jgi:hypothetical protein